MVLRDLFGFGRDRVHLHNGLQRLRGTKTEVHTLNGAARQSLTFRTEDLYVLNLYKTLIYLLSLYTFYVLSMLYINISI